MTRRKALIIVAIFVVVVAAAVALLLSDNSNNSYDTAEQIDTFDGIAVEYHGNEYCEVAVDFGDVKRSATVHETIRLTNNSDAPIVLLDYSTQCRCMWLEFKREPIAPNESTDITLTFDSRGQWGSVGNYMEIATSCDSAPIILWIGAEIE